jgi:hypothetical protein
MKIDDSAQELGKAVVQYFKENPENPLNNLSSHVNGNKITRQVISHSIRVFLNIF